MFLLKSVYNLFYPDFNRQDIENDLEIVREELDKEIKKYGDEISFENNLKIKEKEKENSNLNLDNPKCFKKAGIITTFNGNDGIIDDTYVFNISKTCNDIRDLKNGDKVEYLAFMPDGHDTNLQIAKILTVNEVWGDLSIDEKIEMQEFKDVHPEFFNTHDRINLGIIARCSDNEIKVLVNGSTITIDYDKISKEFVPNEGDLVHLECIVQTDESYVDKSGEILEYKSVRPASQRTMHGIVKEINEDRRCGYIDDNIFFKFDILEFGCKPNVGDKVKAEVIENDKLNWRCLKLKIIEKINLAQKLIEQNEIFNDKNGIVITGNIKFSFKDLSESDIKELVVKNENTHTHKILRSYLKIQKSKSQLTLVEPNTENGIFLKPGESIIFKFRAVAKFFGYSSEVFEIRFGGGFSIARKIEIDVGDVNDPNYKINEDFSNINGGYSTRRGANSYHKNSYNAGQVWDNYRKGNVIPGIGPNVRPKFVKVNFGQYEVPQRLKDAVLNSKTRQEVGENVENLFPSLSNELCSDNYVQRFQALLHIEEIEQFVQFRQYDQERAHFGKEGEYLRLDIENLAEKRPSLIIGDSLQARSLFNTNDDSAHQAIIHKVLFNRILVKFNEEFQSKYKGEDYKLEFFFSRTCFRKQHYAILKIQSILGNEFLFPSKITLNDWPQLDVEFDNNMDLIVKDSNEKLKWFNPLLNDVQKIAITNILRGEAKTIPYVIFGPPGTGKTSCLIETILQLIKNCPGSRLLIGAPSNSAADLITTRLIESNELKPGEFIRLVGMNSIEKDLIAEHLKPYCATIDIAIEGTRQNEMIVTESGLKLRCQKQHIGKHRLTIGTCMTLGTLIQLGFPNDHFTHVLIDEAGQCLESELMVALLQVDKKNGKIILAGDPLQLGPIVLNKYASEKGLETSYLVRLLNRPPYMKDVNRYGGTGFNPRLLTKLIYNYRSLPSILKPFNDLFYNSELQSCIDSIASREVNILKKVTTHKLFSNCENLSESHGVFFYDIRGQNRQDPDSPSWYNAEEATAIYRFVLNLYRLNIEPQNIGVITPYQRQVKKIRNLFKMADNLRLPKIGSVEEFQGQERDIILISTVRSAKTLISMDLKYSLGFVQNGKRMNVAISRARALLIIFGNSELLSLDSNWEKLINYCMETNSFITT